VKDGVFGNGVEVIFEASRRQRKQSFGIAGSGVSR
jgi:hypothetical protein